MNWYGSFEYQFFDWDRIDPKWSFAVIPTKVEIKALAEGIELFVAEKENQ